MSKQKNTGGEHVGERESAQSNPPALTLDPPTDCDCSPDIRGCIAADCPRIDDAGRKLIEAANAGLVTLPATMQADPVIRAQFAAYTDLVVAASKLPRLVSIRFLAGPVTVHNLDPVIALHLGADGKHKDYEVAVKRDRVFIRAPGGELVDIPRSACLLRWDAGGDFERACEAVL